MPDRRYGGALAFNGNAALKMPPIPEPRQTPPPPSKAPAKSTVRKKKREARREEKHREKQEAAAQPIPVWRKLSTMILGIATAAMVVLTLLSYARLVMINDDAVALRSQLSQLQAEQTKLSAQYELSYDLQEIESEMISSGLMTKIQSWQSYTLELSEPDQVEYHQASDVEEKVNAFFDMIFNGVKAYFGR